jgi:fluoride exporter
MTYLLIAIGGAIGSVARYICGSWIAGLVGAAFPWGTIAVNVVGSGAIGAFAAMGTDHRWPLMVGLLGGFTTFSSFSLQTLELMRANQWWQAGANVMLSVALCLASVALGYWLMNLAGQSR